MAFKREKLNGDRLYDIEQSLNVVMDKRCQNDCHLSQVYSEQYWERDGEIIWGHEMYQ